MKTISSQIYTQNQDDLFVKCNCIANNIEFTLLDSSQLKGNRLIIEKIDSSVNTVTVRPASGQTVESESYIEISMQSQSVELLATNEGWEVISDNGDFLQLESSVGIIGFEWNVTQDTVTRFNDLEQSDFDNIYPYSDIRVCNLADDGTVNAYYGDPTFAEDGTNGQVMTEIPLVYTKREMVTEGSDTIRKFYFSKSPYANFEIDPAFTKGDSTVDKIYVSTYDGSIYDTSASAYLLLDEQVANFTETTVGDVLCSISGAKPCSGETQDLTIVKSRILANNRGDGWGLLDVTAVCLMQDLLFCEYANLNSQLAVGRGVVDKESGTGNEAENTGATSSLGNGTGDSGGTDGLCSIRWRGVENLWGNIYSWIDGININNNVLWINPTNINHESDKFTTPYIEQGTLLNADGYVGEVLDTKYGMFCTNNNGSSAEGLCDYYYQSTGLRVARLGGLWADGSFAGVACWNLSNSSAARHRSIGARLMYR